MIHEFAVYKLKIAVYAFFSEPATGGHGGTLGVEYRNEKFQPVELEMLEGKPDDQLDGFGHKSLPRKGFGEPVAQRGGVVPQVDFHHDSAREFPFGAVRRVLENQPATALAESFVQDPRTDAFLEVENVGLGNPGEVFR